MNSRHFSLILDGLRETSRLAEGFAKHACAGDTILIEGPVGAGKSYFARAFIQARFGADQEVPSPSFTLVQTYGDGPDTIWHADLYRLRSTDEIAETGLFDMFDDAICLVEWPDRLGAERPVRFLKLTLQPDQNSQDTRHCEIETEGTWNWIENLVDEQDMDKTRTMPREALIRTFLTKEGWGAAARAPLAGDASNRRYERLSHPDLGPAVLMDAPPEKGEDVSRFVAMTQVLHNAKLSAPDLLATDTEHGLLLLEDLGDDLFARICSSQPELEPDLYSAAVDLLAHFQLNLPPFKTLPPYDLSFYLRETAIVTEWYLPAASGRTPDALSTAEYIEIMTQLCRPLEEIKPAVVLRDFHAENLLWLPDRKGDRRVGLLDYQDALAGHPAYDLVSLLEDARRDTSRELQETMLTRFVATSGYEDTKFRRAYATLGAQRNLKILGLFARLCRRDGKPGYLANLPRVWAHLMHDLEHPALADLKAWVLANLPEPTPEVQARIAS